MNENANAVVARFRELQLDTNEPKWSSWVLNRFFEKTLSDGSLRDVYEGLNTALKVYAVKLTTTVATLIKEVVVQGFTQHRSTYDSMTWSWANSELSNGASAAQCYLFLLALPSEAATPQSIVAIFGGLQGTSYQQEAQNTLSDDLEKPEVQRLLSSK
jgi:hypothetical protein